jgi:hypothetical protein
MDDIGVEKCSVAQPFQRFPTDWEQKSKNREELSKMKGARDIS